jgi:hypothetical protein
MVGGLVGGWHSVSTMDSASGGENLCTLPTGLHHVVFADAQCGSDMVEIAVVGVDVLDQDKVDACHAVQTLAAAVWPQLPHEPVDNATRRSAPRMSGDPRDPVTCPGLLPSPVVLDVGSAETRP